MKITHLFATLAICSMMGACNGRQHIVNRSPVDYVNPYIGNISHLLVPTFPTIQLPNSMLRVYPERADYTTELLNGLPLIVTNHRERSAFNLSPYQGENLCPIITYIKIFRILPTLFQRRSCCNRRKSSYILNSQIGRAHV